MQHAGSQILVTERLILRRFTIEDAEASFRNWTGDPLTTIFLTWPTHQDEEVTRTIISQWVKNYAHSSFYQWAIVPKALGEPIGTISFVEINEKVGSVQVGYCIGSRYWHQGYTSEALAALIAFAFTTLEAGRVEAMHDPANRYSGKVMEKCGMRHEGTLRKADWSNRGIVDAAVYGILREEFRD